MEDFIFAPIVLVLGLAVHAWLLRQHSRTEQQYLTLGFMLHIGAAFGQVLLTLYYFGGGDMTGYFAWGVPMAEALRNDFTSFLPGLVEGFFHLESDIPIEFYPGGGSTTSMSAISIWLLYLFGNSLYACVLIFGVGSYLSKVLIYRAIREDFAIEVRPYLLVGLLLLPTAAFWSSGMLKEPVVMVMLGPLILGLRWLAAGHRRLGAVLLVIGAASVIAMIKPYVLMVLSIASALFYLAQRFRSRDSILLKPFAIVTAGVLGMSGFVLGNRFFAKQEEDSAAASFARQRSMGYGIEGGSNYNLDGPGEGEDVGSRSAIRELALVPLALFTALFRPLIIESRNAVQLASGIEATVLLVLFVQIVRKKSWMGLFRAVRSSPVLLFSAVFVIALGLGTALSSSNLGTLSRYRSPMMPFFFMMLLVLRYGDEAVKKAALKKVGASQSPGPVARRPAVAALAPRSAGVSRFR